MTAPGRLVESTIGAHLVNRAHTEDIEVFWWRDGNYEVDFVVECDDVVTAIEVKSGRVKPTGGLDEFVLRYPHAHTLVVGSPQCSVEDFLLGKIDLFPSWCHLRLYLLRIEAAEQSLKGRAVSRCNLCARKTC